MERSSVPTVVIVAAVALVASLVYGVVQQQTGVGSDALDRAVPQTGRARAADGTVVGVTYHDDADASREFAKENGFASPTVRDPVDTLFTAYGNRGIPKAFVLDRRGRIVELRRGPIDRAYLDQAIARARAAS